MAYRQTIERERYEPVRAVEEEPREKPAQKAGWKLESIVYWIGGIIEALLGIRVALSLLGANQGNPFAQFIYSVTYPFVAPFYGLFSTTFQSGVSRLELEALTAMVVVALITWAVAALIHILRR